MRLRRRLGLLAVVIAAALAGCTPNSVVAGTEVRVAVAEPLTSLNAATSHGRASTTNADVAWLTGSAFAWRDGAGQLVLDESFGEAEVIARDPLTVRYTIAEGVRWSDGAAVDASDLLLAWAANSGALDDVDFDDTPYIDAETGRYRDDFPRDAVFFDGAKAGGIELATQTPQFGGERTLFVHFDALVVDWRTALAPGVAAHALARDAWGFDAETPVAELKAAVIDAITTDDRSALAELSRAWNSALDLAAEPSEALRVASGPYMLDEVAGDGTIALVANPEYGGERRPVIETIRLRVVSDPLETVALVASGELDVATPTPSADVLAAVARLDGVAVTHGIAARYEHLDLQFDDGHFDTFDDPRVREAFLLTVPRDEIVDQLVVPLAPEARVLDSFTLAEGAPGYAETVAANGSARFAAVDLERAAALLAEAGVDEPRVCLLFDPDNPRRRAAFELIRANAAEAGFRVSDCSRPNWQSLLGVAGVYDAALFSWDTSRLGPAAVGAVFRSDSAVVNLNRYANPEVDALVDELERRDDDAERAALLAEIDALLWADAYGLPLYSHPTLTLVSERVDGVERSPSARGVFAEAWEWRPAE